MCVIVYFSALENIGETYRGQATRLEARRSVHDPDQSRARDVKYVVKKT
jgi:hypothetical protein